MERWLPVVGYVGYYSVSNEGLVRRESGHFRGRVLKPGLVGGYGMVSLSKRGFSKRHMVHRLVMAAFVGPLPAGYQVNHKDMNKMNNRADNLEYLTASANVKHAYANGRTVLRGEKNGAATISDEEALHIRQLYRDGFRQADIARLLSISKFTVFYVVRRRTWAHLPA